MKAKKIAIATGIRTTWAQYKTATDVTMIMMPHIVTMARCHSIFTDGFGTGGLAAILPMQRRDERRIQFVRREKQRAIVGEFGIVIAAAENIAGKQAAQSAGRFPFEIHNFAKTKRR
jgi:hypothetical protein